MKRFIVSFLIGLGALAGLYSSALGLFRARWSTLELPGLAPMYEYSTMSEASSIHAQSEDDAYRALGYVQAQHRLFQGISIGDWAVAASPEIFGERAVGVDRYFRTLGIRAFAQTMQKIRDLYTDAYRLSLAYIDGINRYRGRRWFAGLFGLAMLNPNPLV